MDLYSPVTELKGIGKSRAKLLEKLNIRTLYDLLAYFPRDYEDRTKLVSICDLIPGESACFEAMVISNPTVAHIRKGMDITRLKVADETGRLTLTFFNQSYVKDQLQYGESYFFYGTLQEDFGASMASPSFERIDSSGTVTNRILPVYALTAGLSNKVLISCVRQALDACADDLPEILPDEVRRQYHLCGVRMAYESVHNPASLELLMQAKKRLVFEEFFIFSAGLALLREKRKGIRTVPYDAACIREFCDSLPFQLTAAQRRVIDEIGQDLQKGAPMNRLVQGDVGSGKTVIAAAACLCAVKNGHQAAFMAPTEILAEQHAETLSRIMASFGVSVVLLTGSITGAARKLALASIADGSAQLIIGTHALISDCVSFADLGLVVADEQHRFGVAQRAALTAKGVAASSRHVRHPHPPHAGAHCLRRSGCFHRG
ncbi:MAG: DEAD/DEAH box helicase [Clostridia bacterium]|nr:DEAD/DEAH box helicase [Clostridia bacterium]